MKTYYYIFFLLIFAINSTFAQDIVGKWEGQLKVPGAELKIVFNVSKTGDSYQATMDSPDQGALGIPVTQTTYADGLLKLEIPKAMIAFAGKLENGMISGTFTQAGNPFALNLVRTIEQVIERPQEPKEPYPYISEKVFFLNPQANIKLAGTLTLPSKEKSYPVVILISGSGPQNRNSEIFGHKPFLVISDYLTRNGIAVLRFDDRGIEESEGIFQMATTLDFADDVESALNYLKSRKDVKFTNFGLIGHSEGGAIAPIVASRNKAVDFIVLLAGPGLKGDELLLLQKRVIELQMGYPLEAVESGQKLMAGAYKIIVEGNDEYPTVKSKVNQYFKGELGAILPENQVASIVDQVTTLWMINFIRHNPAIYLQKVKCPVLAVNGEKDLQVPPKEHLKAIEEALTNGGNKFVTTKEFPSMNHLFQECETGAVAEYGKITQTFSPIVMEYFTNWIKNQKK
jgi:hypothetical protein